MSNKELTAEHIRPGRTYRPHVDVVETDADIRLWADMPGVDESSVEVHLKEDVLSIEGRVSTEDYAELMPLYTEYKVGNYAQRFAVSPTIDSDAIRATMRHGVLELVLPKLAEARPRRIDVTAS
jgi:HSP20 family molecular chaperone IbpA